MNNVLSVIYVIGATAIGFLLGMIFEMIMDSRIIRELQEDNRRLRLINNQLKHEQKREVVEIVDKRASNPDNLFQPF